MNWQTRAASLGLLSLGIGVGIGLSGRIRPPATAQDVREKPPASTSTRPSPAPKYEHDHLMPDTAAAYAPDWEKPYPQYQPLDKVLKRFPSVRPGDLVPQDLYRYGGRGVSSFASVDDVRDFGQFYRDCCEMKPKVMAERLAYMKLRYDFSGNVRDGVTMTRGKPVAQGPVVRLPQGVASWERLADLSPRELRERGLFPEG